MTDNNINLNTIQFNKISKRNSVLKKSSNLIVFKEQITRLSKKNISKHLSQINNEEDINKIKII